ncbi:hypothetical protein ACLB2K_006892 [Fragaria x ananassa]
MPNRTETYNKALEFETPISPYSSRIEKKPFEGLKHEKRAFQRANEHGRREFRRREDLDSRTLRVRYLSHGSTREPLIGLGWELGRRQTDWDQCGGLQWPDGLGKLFRAEGEGERIRREEREKRRGEKILAGPNRSNPYI